MTAPNGSNMDVTPYGTRAAAHAADAVRGRIGAHTPELALILGSGLGGLASRLEEAVRVPFAEVPGFPVPSVVGHAGELVSGTLGGRRVVALGGRFHMYEGHPAARAGFPVRVMRALGARTLFVANAAGGLRRTFAPGQLMIIADHINLAQRNPLIGAVEPGEERFPDMSAPYDPALRAALRQAAARAGVRVEEGVYGWLLGPTYETPAEVRMLERFGVDVVGMSTVPEVIVARAIGMRVAGISCVTNPAAGITTAAVDHADVLDVTRRAAGAFEAVVTEWVRAYAQ